jgi:CelD/BcsL family acetyltransferase involved in cellulose biosynthesis
MKVTLVPGRELGPDLVAAWTGLQAANPDLVSPYFHPEFTKAIAAVRSDVEVAVVEADGAIVALFPFQREQASLGLPVGGIISDYQGLICAQGFQFSPTELLQQCRLDSWDFDHLIASQSSLTPFHWSTDASPQIDVSKGYEAYVHERRAAGSEQIKKTYNLMRRIEREIGALRFIADSTDAQALDNVLGWKSDQYRTTGNTDLFVPGWIREAIYGIWERRADGFSGALSLLYAGDRLIAGHMGMRSRHVWHYWFPAYDSRAAKYSPGLILLVKIAEHAPQTGVGMIDLGKGTDAYKGRLMNASTLLASGRLELPSWRSFLGRTSRVLRSRLRDSSLGPSARAVVQWLLCRLGSGRQERKAEDLDRRYSAEQKRSAH